MASASEPNLPRNRDREVPPRRGENIDEDKDKKPERDKVPDTPPTEPEPVPVEEPPQRPDKRGPYIVQFGAIYRDRRMSLTAQRLRPN